MKEKLDEIAIFAVVPSTILCYALFKVLNEVRIGLASVKIKVSVRKWQEFLLSSIHDHRTFPCPSWPEKWIMLSYACMERGETHLILFCTI